MTCEAYAIAEVGAESPGGFSPRGGALALWRCRDHEVMLAGPAETGKTYSCCQKLDALLWKYPRSQAVVIRKTLASLFTTVLQTYRNVLGPASPVSFYGGAKPEWADYPNGSRVYFAGMDNPQKALSSERDFIYCNQAEELLLDDWETLTTRCTGRAGNAPYPQIMGDCNPGPPNHWIKHRASITFLTSRHEDNPTLFADSGTITEQGKFSLAILDSLTGVRKARLRHGLWVAAEGTVYAEEWDEQRNLVTLVPLPRFRRYVVSIDWGYTNAGVLLVWGVDGDGRMTLVREIYRTGKLIGWWVDQAKKVRDEFRPEKFVCDPSRPEHIQEFVNAGLPAVGAFNDIELGIQAVKERLLPAGDDLPRLVIARDCNRDVDPALSLAKMPVSVVDEFTLYVYPKGQDGKSLKELPVDADNHGCFVGNTMIVTARGLVAIDSVVPGDRAWTRDGFRPVVACGMTSPAAPLWEVCFSDDRRLIGTGNHPIYVKSEGFVPLSALRYADIMEVADRRVTPCRESWKSSSTRASSSGVIRTQNGGRVGTTSFRATEHASGGLAVCTRRYGRTPTARSPMVMRFITGTRIRSTTTSTTWNAFPRPTISPSMRPNTPRRSGSGVGRSSPMSASGPRTGMAPRKVGRGIASMARKPGPVEPSRITSAISAARLTGLVRATARTGSARINAVRRRAAWQVPITWRFPALGVISPSRATGSSRKRSAPVSVLTVRELNRAEPVYNLTVDGCPEYYANGVLVHNCDALRYGVAYVDMLGVPRPGPAAVAGKRPTLASPHTRMIPAPAANRYRGGVR